MTEGHWMVVRKAWWPLYFANGAPWGVPVAEAATGAVVAIVAFRRGLPYTLATARAVVNSHNEAVNAARRKTRDTKETPRLPG